jgi:hypothetical protein
MAMAVTVFEFVVMFDDGSLLDVMAVRDDSVMREAARAEAVRLWGAGEWRIAGVARGETYGPFSVDRLLIPPNGVTHRRPRKKAT